MDLLTFRAWLEHGGSLEYAHWCEAWAIEAEEAQAAQRVAAMTRNIERKPGRRGIVHLHEEAS